MDMFVRVAYLYKTTQKFDKEIEKRFLSFDKKDFNVIIPIFICRFWILIKEQTKHIIKNLLIKDNLLRIITTKRVIYSWI